MMSKKSFTRSEKEKRNYAIVRNITGDAKLARKARSWSEKRIKETYGLTDIPKTAPRLKPLRKPDYKKKYALVKKITGDVKLARDARSWSYKRIKETYGTIKKPSKIKKVTEEPKKEKTKDRESWFKKKEEARKEQWRAWATEIGFPYQIQRLVKFINQKNDFDDFAGYGFAVVWHSFVIGNSLDGETLMFYEQNLIPDKHDGDIYSPRMII